jgi:pimeloyl-ACP methyl ester carboxylesterase
VDHRPGDAPPLSLLLTEPGRALGELSLYFALLPALLALPRGDGHPVLVLPGLMADDTSTSALRAVLRRLGYAVYGWRLGRNIGPTASCVDGLRTCLSDLARRHGRAVSLIGWSLGGIFAREQAREMPGSVRQVITLASPFRLARPGQTRAHRAFERYSHLHVKRPDLPLERDGKPLPVPATSLYSHLDGIVAWESCLDTAGDRSENIAVLASHLGIGHHPAAVYAVADRLAQAEGGWKPFRPPPVLRPAFPRPHRPAAPVTA